MKNADDSLVTMLILRILADKNNQKILFSPKPFNGKAGSGLHHHIFLKDIKTGKNIMQNLEFEGD
jgi:glutamine synthetase